MVRVVVVVVFLQFQIIGHYATDNLTQQKLSPRTHLSYFKSPECVKYLLKCSLPCASPSECEGHCSCDRRQYVAVN